MIATDQWRAICPRDQLAPDRGAAALLPEGQVAVVLTSDGDLYCVGHHDPFSGANVIARGIVGSTTVDSQRIPTIASPMYKQVFDLRDGRCLAEPEVGLGSWEVRVRDGFVEVGQCVVPPAESNDD